jgi:tetratricopeptide (TPR) repeat protein
MNTVSKLQTLAIAAAKASDWQKALELNQEILHQFPQDVGGLNRLGMAHMQLGNNDAAKEAFQLVLEIDKHNPIAQKQLERIKTNQIPPSPAFTRNHFIEEPGKTKIVELHRLSGRQVLDCLSVSQPCSLKLKNRYISVETEDGKYVGALPEDISFRLTKLIQTGNTYHCSIHSCSNNQCTVYLKELTRSPENVDVHSFPPSKTSNNQLDLDDRILIEDFEDDDAAVDGEEDEVEELDSQREQRRPTNPDFEE